MSHKIIKLQQVKNRTGLSRSSIYAAIQSGTFPPQIHLGIRSVGWLDSAISDWIDQRINAATKNTKPQSYQMIGNNSVESNVVKSPAGGNHAH